MSRLTKEEMKEQPNKPYALCTTGYPAEIKIFTVGHIDCDIVTASYDNGEIKKFKIQEEKNTERSFFVIQYRKVYLDECVRYETPWLPRLED